MKKSPIKGDIKCCCGHKKSQHRLYENFGLSRKGSRYVCTRDNCSWQYCDIGTDGAKVLDEK